MGGRERSSCRRVCGGRDSRIISGVGFGVLDEADFCVQAALWTYKLERNSWRLVLVSPGVDKEGILESYRKIRPILSQIPDNQLSGHLSNISLHGTNHLLMTFLREKCLTKGEFPKRAYHIGDLRYYVDEAYIYRLK